MDILETIREANKTAGAKQVALALHKLGKPCRANFVRSQGYQQETTRLNFVEKAFMWFEAYAATNFAAFELVWNLFEHRKRELWRRYGKQVPPFPSEAESALKGIRDRIDALILEGAAI